MIDESFPLDLLSRNRLLSTLGADDFELLALHFRYVPLRQGILLQEQEAPVEHVYFR